MASITDEMGQREQSPWGWWTVWDSLDALETDLERICPNPVKVRIIDPNGNYSLPELRGLLQQFGSYLSTLNTLRSKINAQCHALKEGISTGIDIGLVGLETRETTVAGKRAEILATNDVFKDGKKKQIEHEAYSTYIGGWINAYQSGWDTVSRMVTIDISEAENLTGRTP